jgi:hypothetical protein
MPRGRRVAAAVAPGDRGEYAITTSRAAPPKAIPAFAARGRMPQVSMASFFVKLFPPHRAAPRA